MTKEKTIQEHQTANENEKKKKKNPRKTPQNKTTTQEKNKHFTSNSGTQK